MPATPFSVPHVIDADLRRILQHWQALKRKDNPVPFADDLDLVQLADVERRLFVLDIFEKPMRARFQVVGRDLSAQYGESLEGRFLDEIAATGPCRYLSSQWSATCEAEAPTYFAHTPMLSPTILERGYARLLLPLWGQGYVSMILGAVAWCEQA